MYTVVIDKVIFITLLTMSISGELSAVEAILCLLGDAQAAHGVQDVLIVAKDACDTSSVKLLEHVGFHTTDMRADSGVMMHLGQDCNKYRCSTTIQAVLSLVYDPITNWKLPLQNSCNTSHLARTLLANRVSNT